MLTALTRTVVALVSLSIWLGLIATSVAAGHHGTLGAVVAAALVLVTIAYAVTLPFVIMVLSDPEDSSPSVIALAAASLSCGVVVGILGVVTVAGFDTWYLNHYGTDTTARVAEARCDGSSTVAGECEQNLRVVASTGADLGWVGCNGTGFWHVGDPVQLRSDPRGFVPPSVSNCPPEGFLDTVVPLTVILEVISVTTAVVGVPPVSRWRRRPADTAAQHSHPMDAAESQPDPTDTPGWLPPADA